MPTETFKASRWTKGNLFFPTLIEVSDSSVVRKKPGLISRNEMSIHIKNIASVRIQTGLLWSDILIESSGGTDAISSHGHKKADAIRIKEIIESSQTRHLGAVPKPAPVEPTKTCPYCAETIKTAAKVCRFCNHELPTE